MNIKIYDNEGASLDRITIVLLDEPENKKGHFTCLSACETGNAFFQHTTGADGEHLGKQIYINDLTPELQHRLRGYFNLQPIQTSERIVSKLIMYAFNFEQGFIPRIFGKDSHLTGHFTEKWGMAHGKHNSPTMGFIQWFSWLSPDNREEVIKYLDFHYKG